jgi:hypothetical protein
MAEAKYPVTLVWPASALVATIGGQWQRLDDGRIEAVYNSPDELAVAMIFKDLVPPTLRLSMDGPGGAPKTRPYYPCTVCGCSEWWERPAGAGGGWLCSRCHPSPAQLTHCVHK